MTVSAIITAAGKNSRMRKDQLARNIDLKNKSVDEIEEIFSLQLTEVEEKYQLSNISFLIFYSLCFFLLDF